MFNTRPTIVSIEEMDSYIDSIEYDVITGRLNPNNMRIVERYKVYKKNRVFREVDFKKLMRYLMGEDAVMKTNIIKTEIQERKLQEEISKYKIMNNRVPYLMMNEETMDALTKLHISEFQPGYISDTLKNDSKLAVFQGNKCYVDNDLPFGEVEIR